MNADCVDSAGFSDQLCSVVCDYTECGGRANIVALHPVPGRVGKLVCILYSTGIKEEDKA